jgi:Putative DNA-binding domain
MTDAIAREAHRQQTLLAAVLAAPDRRAGHACTDRLQCKTALPAAASALGLIDRGARAERGLAAYRINAAALADRALGSAFPTVRTMLGDADFARCAAAYWRADPPTCGDLGTYGDGYAEWLANDAALAPWPWLADCARLDAALHRCERAADATFDAASLTLLNDADPAALRLELRPGASVIAARWPVATILAAHRDSGDAGDAPWIAVRAAIDARVGETVLVVRSGWRAEAVCLETEVEHAWAEALVEGADLDTALRRAGAAFDFAAWLARAVRCGWVRRVSRTGR